MKLENSNKPNDNLNENTATNQIPNQTNDIDNNNNNSQVDKNGELTTDGNSLLLNNLIHLQHQQQFEYIINELINQQQQLQLKIQLEQQLQQQYNQIIPSTIDLSLINNLLLRNNSIIPIVQGQTQVPSTHLNTAQSQQISSPISSTCSTTTESSYPFARIEIDYSSDSTNKNFVYFINKKKITIGRKLNPSLINSDKLADILIENSTLVSRHHFSIELISSRTNHYLNNKNTDFSYIESEQSDNEEPDNDNINFDKTKFFYWKLLCTSKNGLFINTRYIQTGKHVRLLNKKYTFRFPNTNIKIYFESLLETPMTCTPSPTLTSMSPNSLEDNETKTNEFNQDSVKKEAKTTQSNNKIAQILMQKQLEQQQQQQNQTPEVIPKKEEFNHDESSNLSASDKNDTDNGSKKPPFSYAQLIAQAISSSKEQQLTLSQIYQFISSNYSYYKLDDKGWQNSIRHNLSLNRNFVKVARQQNEPGKGSFWRIESSSELKVKEQAYSRKSRSSTPNGINRIQVQSSPNSSSSSSSLTEPKEEVENVEKEESKQTELPNNQQLLLNLIQNQTAQIPCLTVQPLDQIQAILNNNLNILNSNPGLIQLLYQNLTQSQANQNFLVLQPQVPQVQEPKTQNGGNNNSVKLRLLLNDDSNGANNSKRTLSQVLNEQENSHENAQKKSCQENGGDNSKLSGQLVVMVDTGLNNEKQ